MSFTSLISQVSGLTGSVIVHNFFWIDPEEETEYPQTIPVDPTIRKSRWKASEKNFSGLLNIAMGSEIFSFVMFSMQAAIFSTLK